MKIMAIPGSPMDWAAPIKINDGLQAYFDLERGDGSSYDENWSWDVGLRWSF